jgi:hypoxanthine phosphoribosyltransferase
MDFNYTENIVIKDLEFKKFIDNDDLQITLDSLAKVISQDYAGEPPVFVVLLNGAFVFAADLLRKIDFGIETLFVKISSYHDLESTGEVKIDKHILDQLAGRKVLLIEDIIDTGTTMHYLLAHLNEIGVNDIEICSLLVKPGKLKYSIKIKYFGYHIGDEFVVGYGLDYNEHGRNLKHIFQLQQSNDNGR